MKDQIRGVIYDLDGTIIVTEALHEAAWKVAAERIGVILTPQMLTNQKGRPAREFAEDVLTADLRGSIDDFVSEKQRYVHEHLREIDFFPGFLDVQDALERQGIIVWICTSASQEFVDQCFQILPELRHFEKRVITCDMYKRGKPSKEPLLLTLKLMGELNTAEAVYVGDAYSDYLSTVNADMRFIYFNAVSSRRDERIPRDIPMIQNHKEILGLIE